MKNSPPALIVYISWIAVVGCGATNAASVPSAIAPQSDRLVWLGGPTAILERGGFRLLTDPMLGPHGPRSFTLPRHPSTGEVNAAIARYTDPPAVDMTPLDAVILSHGHNDHFDQRARELLPKTTLFIIPPSIEPLVRAAGFDNVRTVDWNESTVLTHGAAALRITAVPAHHSHDPAIDVQLGKVNGYVLSWEAPAPTYTMYWTGDSVVYDGQAEGLAGLGPIDLLLPHMGGVGGDSPLGLRTMDADEAVGLISRVQPREVIPIHHTTFGHYREPISALVQRAAAAGLAARLTIVPEGGTTSLQKRPSF